MPRPGLVRRGFFYAAGRRESASLDALQLLVHDRSNLRPEQLDGLQHFAMRHRADVNMQEEAVEAEVLAQQHDLLRNELGVADIQRAPQSAGLVVGGAVVAGPAAFFADGAHLRLVMREESIGGSLRRIADEAVRVRGDPQLREIMAGLGGGAAIEINQRGESFRHAADDRENDGQAEHACANGGFRVAPGSDPDRQRLLHRPRVHALVVDGRAMAAWPAHFFRLPDVQQQLQLLVEQLVVIIQAVAEQGERLDERAPPRHDFGTSVRKAVESGKLLVDADGIVRGQNRDGAGQADLLSQGRRSGKHDGRSAARIIRPVMLSDAVDVQTGLLGDDDLLDRVAQTLGVTDRRACSRGWHSLQKRADSKFHLSR
ncbi:hypothetical protein BN871_EU_00060 [Paenibacillus sp. P22]|nr:hypothetical protein BN871_EU_00060 [Paenibacillus sp. P22]